MASYWHTLAKLGAPELGRSLNFSPLIQAGFCALLALGFVHPQLAYPIARRRLADVVFGLSLTQLGFALTLPALSVFVPCLIGQLVSGQYMPGLGLPSFITLELGLLPLLPLFACVSLARTSVRRILLGAPVAVVIFFAALTHAIWNRWILTAPGLALVAIATTVTLLLLRWRLRHHYGTCDLNVQPDASSLIGAQAAGHG